MFLYCATLLSCFVFSFAWFPPMGGYGHVYQKALRAKVEEDIFALMSASSPTFIPLHTPTLPPPPTPFPVALLTDRHPPGCGLPIYALFVGNSLRPHLRWTTTFSAAPTPSRLSELGIIDADITINTSTSSSPPPRDDGVYLFSIPPYCSPSFQHLPVSSTFTTHRHFLHLLFSVFL